jgi:hypothetical protein
MERHQGKISSKVHKIPRPDPPPELGEQSFQKGFPPIKMKVGQLVVLVDEVDGLEAGREGCIMGVRDDMLTVGCQTSERLHLVLAHTWQVLPRELFRRLSAREGREL